MDEYDDYKKRKEGLEKKFCGQGACFHKTDLYLIPGSTCDSSCPVSPALKPKLKKKREGRNLRCVKEKNWSEWKEEGGSG